MVLRHPLFQGLVECAVIEDEGMNAREEVSRGKNQREVMHLKGTAGRNFFRPPSPPGRAERGGSFNCRQAVVIVDAGQAGHPQP